MVVSLICGGFAYAIGASGTPGLDEAQSAKQQSNVSARAESRDAAFKDAKVSGRREGLGAGMKTGRRVGAEAGRRAGDRERAAVAAREQTSAPQVIPGLFPGETLPPIPDGADEPNPAELCAQAPRSAEQLGYYCP